MKNPLKKKPQKDVDPRTTPRREGPVTYRPRPGWGSAIGFNGYNPGEAIQLVYGFAPETRPWGTNVPGKPHLGDLFEVEMTSGQTAQFVFIEVKHWHDPADGWSGKVKFKGYLDA